MKKDEARDVRSLHLGAMKALKRAVSKAIARHASAGVPAAIWRDGRVIYLSKERLKRRS